jgi:predicted N-acetyltransferase YhbS
MKLQIREATTADAPECGRICHDAFAAIANAHGFPPDFPSVDVAVGAVSGLIAHPGFFGVVAEDGGRILGSNFLDERSMIQGVGPIAIDLDVQNRRIGLVLMNAVLERSVQ